MINKSYPYISSISKKLDVEETGNQLFIQENMVKLLLEISEKEPDTTIDIDTAR